MKTKQYDKRPLTVWAFKFDAGEALRLLQPGLTEITVGPATLRRQDSGVWHVYNPGRFSTSEGPWQRVANGDYVIIAPTGCCYPVQADQFERNYTEVVDEADCAIERVA